MTGHAAPTTERRGRRRLTGDETLAGLRYTADGLLCGTPRVAVDDPRFDKAPAPADAFAPHAVAVWAVLDRLSWFTLADAEQLLDTADGVRPQQTATTTPTFRPSAPPQPRPPAATATPTGKPSKRSPGPST